MEQEDAPVSDRLITNHAWPGVIGKVAGVESYTWRLTDHSKTHHSKTGHTFIDLTVVDHTETTQWPAVKSGPSPRHDSLRILSRLRHDLNRNIPVHVYSLTPASIPRVLIDTTKQCTCTHLHQHAFHLYLLTPPSIPCVLNPYKNPQ